MPRVVIAAPASGHGKTTVATGLMAALRASGLAVSPHKVGPDYIDPGYHALATGRPGRNLDPVLCGPELVAPLFLHGARGADVAVVEGVMGLYDGVYAAPGSSASGSAAPASSAPASSAPASSAFGSTAHVAGLLEAPVILVVDGSSQGRSVAALVSGFRDFDAGVNLAGVVLNRVGSDRHEEILRSALAQIGMPVLGVLRRDDALSTPSRHLGLVPAAERSADAAVTVRRMGEAIAQSLDLQSILSLSRSAGALDATRWEPVDALSAASAASRRFPAGSTRRLPNRSSALPAPAAHSNARPVVAVAGGAAFTFGYAETAELLAAAGAEVVTVDPLREESLPPGTAALVVGGGFPEVHADGLSANAPLREQVRDLAQSGAPVIAECAGLLYLARSLDGRPMCGVIDATARMTARLTLGYRCGVAATDSVLAPAGTTISAHEFHRTVIEPGHGAGPAWIVDGRPEGFASGSVHASYLHTHWAAHPQTAHRLVRAAA